jgi:alkylhydroperoxidase family enzyme
LTDATFDALRRHFDEVRIIELFALAGWYHAISYIANGSRTELEDWAPRFPVRRA